jgi:hypothetical protein
MPKFNSNIIKLYKELNKAELVFYLILRRYIEAGENLPLDHIQKNMLRLSDLEMGRQIVNLINKEVIKQDSSSLIDGFTGEKVKIIARDWQSERGGDEHYIYYLLNTYNNSNKDITPISLAKTKVTVKYKRALLSLSAIHIKKAQLDLVNYFADKLIAKQGVGKTPDWRRQQWAIAGRVLREGKLSLSEWKGAIDYFLAQEFWDDKLNSLKQIEANLHQFVMKRKKTTTVNKQVDIIK